MRLNLSPRLASEFHGSSQIQESCISASVVILSLIKENYSCSHASYPYSGARRSES